MIWKEKDLEIALTLLQSGETYSEIAFKLGRTYDSIRNKLQKLGFGYVKEKYISRKCLNCDNTWLTTKSAEKKFCDNSCAASYNNKLRTSFNNFCLNCNKNIKANKKFCDRNCNSQYDILQTYQKIEAGDTSFHQDTIKRYLVYKYGSKCMECGWCDIHPITGKVPIQMEHIDGNSQNNELSNLKLLCPNHHSLTLTYGALNKGNGREKRRMKRQMKQ